jgi:putative protease
VEGTHIGRVTHFYTGISVAVVMLKDEIQVGDSVYFLGHTTDFGQKVTSLQIDHKPINKAGPHQSVAIKVLQRVRQGDDVYKFPEND